MAQFECIYEVFMEGVITSAVPAGLIAPSYPLFYGAPEITAFQQFKKSAPTATVSGVNPIGLLLPHELVLSSFTIDYPSSGGTHMRVTTASGFVDMTVPTSFQGLYESYPSMFNVGSTLNNTLPFCATSAQMAGGTGSFSITRNGTTLTGSLQPKAFCIQTFDMTNISNQPNVNGAWAPVSS